MDLTYLTTVTAYATQGRAINPIYSKTIKLMYSREMTNWLQYHSKHPYVSEGLGTIVKGDWCKTMYTTATAARFCADGIGRATYNFQDDC